MTLQPIQYELSISRHRILLIICNYTVDPHSLILLSIVSRRKESSQPIPEIPPNPQAEETRARPGRNQRLQVGHERPPRGVRSGAMNAYPAKPTRKPNLPHALSSPTCKARLSSDAICVPKRRMNHSSGLNVSPQSGEYRLAHGQEGLLAEEAYCTTVQPKDSRLNALR
jgi:hypothetical protein